MLQYGVCVCVCVGVQVCVCVLHGWMDVLICTVVIWVSKVLASWLVFTAWVYVCIVCVGVGVCVCVCVCVDVSMCVR